MSRFFSSKFDKLIPYTPGEQPKDTKYIKLNTNENPFPPSPKALEYAQREAATVNLYSDPECSALNAKMAEVMGVEPDEVVMTNGSDEALNFAFMAFCDDSHPAAFADITYGFYPVYAEVNGVPYREIPLNDDLTINVEDYIGINSTIFIANPNAPTGVFLSVAEIEKILQSNPNNVVVVDEAYVDFGNESCIPLINKYENLLVIGTFSKSRSLAGSRLGFAIGCRPLIRDLNTLRYSTNPYNINRVTMAAGIGSLEDEDYTRANCRTIIENRSYTEEKLRELGFEMPESGANFLFARLPGISGEMLYLELKKRGILVRHFKKERISDYLRITIGTKEQMDALIEAIKDILS